MTVWVRLSWDFSWLGAGFAALLGVSLLDLFWVKFVSWFV